MTLSNYFYQMKILKAANHSDYYQKPFPFKTVWKIYNKAK